MVPPTNISQRKVLITGGYDASIVQLDERALFAVMILVGVTLISILIGLITDSVNDYMENLTAGTTKVTSGSAALAWVLSITPLPPRAHR